MTNAWLPRIVAHFDNMLANGLDVYGPVQTPMWMASLDTRTGRYPENDVRPEHIGKRVYRNIDAPRGCSMYWDQPMLVAAHALSDVCADPGYREAADAYVRAYLQRCVAQTTGLVLWGNHYFYDAFRDVPVHFAGNEPPEPVDVATASGSWHEIRPLTPAWDLLWSVDAEATDRAVRAAASGHMLSDETGGFNRHADGDRGCAFLEAGAVLIEALAWLYAKTGDASLIAPAEAMARFSFGFRHPQTGLIENNPTRTRWDKTTSTTEIGLWAGCLLRAADYADDHEAWNDIADAALAAWLTYGYDESAKRYYGRLDVRTGKPILGSGTTRFEPGDHADLWRPLFPAHDYPMSFAEACLTLYARTGRHEYALACHRWLDMIEQSLPARDGQGGYAEHYGRCLHFALRCRDELGDEHAGRIADRLADEAVRTLWDDTMFRTHPGEHRYDAVDGLGYLVLALLRHQAGIEPSALALGW